MSRYKAWYDDLMERAQFRGKTEKTVQYFIRPLIFGGDRGIPNTAYLSHREVFLAKWLLTKFTSGYVQMKCLQDLTVYAREYQLPRWTTDIIKRARIKCLQMNGGVFRRRSRILSAIHKARIGLALKGREFPERAERYRGAGNPNYRKFGKLHHNFGKKWKVHDTSKYSAAGYRRWASKRKLSGSNGESP